MSVKVQVQSSAALTVLLATFSPLASRLTVMLCGRLAALPPSQVLETEMSFHGRSPL
jgi:hypothetical protein